MKIERLKNDDVESYKALIDATFGGSNDLAEYIEKYDSRSSSYEIIVAKDDDKVVGAVTFYKLELFTYSFQPALEIFNVAVHSEYRGQKVAKNIFKYIIDFAKDNGYKSINLTCLESAHAAHHLYESVGFERTSSIKFNLVIPE
jgi:ribosomal protein S18 acetylase RimI-like enzyme